jgi:hypothetical protein
MLGVVEQLCVRLGEGNNEERGREGVCDRVYHVHRPI